MSRVELAAEVGEDFERILEHLELHAVEDRGERIREIVDALNVLERNPEIGRPTSDGKRELVIGRRTHGHLALYRYVAAVDTVFILAIRSQKEAGYAERSATE
jgi:plasmid stabilization system protein ParE